ncbi:hypothetical protein GCM10009038_34630 [Salinicola rhizosphaerae]|uniref:Uncharacterized protein n=1 Tax=Salinicola rhizosphaerae TaxID=1443141 RepID=A0ABQ3EC20_9GAMM|nr:hypothetical protein GCM10009038_34630 [Salinicola rhizosphaerae]
MHLVAYALYKSAKYELACNKRGQGLSQDEISSVLQTFHDNLLSTPGEQEQYRERAHRALDGFAAELERRLAEDHVREIESLQRKVHDRDAEIAKLKKSHQSDIKKAKTSERRDFVNKVRQTSLDTKPISVLKWIGNGFSGVFAGVITAILLAAILFAFTPPSERDGAKQRLSRFLIDSLDVSTPSNERPPEVE